jgi:hypothetical protein
MDPLNLLVARQNAADQVRETVDGDRTKRGRRSAGDRGRARSGQEPASTGSASADGRGQLGPVVQVAWWQRLTARLGRGREIGRPATRRRVTVLR